MGMGMRRERGEERGGSRVGELELESWRIGAKILGIKIQSLSQVEIFGPHWL